MQQNPLTLTHFAPVKNIPLEHLPVLILCFELYYIFIRYIDNQYIDLNLVHTNLLLLREFKFFSKSGNDVIFQGEQILHHQ